MQPKLWTEPGYAKYRHSRHKNGHSSKNAATTITYEYTTHSIGESQLSACQKTLFHISSYPNDTFEMPPRASRESGVSSNYRGLACQLLMKWNRQSRAWQTSRAVMTQFDWRVFRDIKDRLDDIFEDAKVVKDGSDTYIGQRINTISNDVRGKYRRGDLEGVWQVG